MKRSRFAALLTLSVMGLSSGTAIAQPAPPPPGQVTASSAIPEVIVVAPRPVDLGKSPHTVISQFAQSHGAPAAETGQLSRWRQGVCPFTEGLPPAFDAFVTTRIEAVAASVGAPKPSGRCDVNVDVVFTPEPQAFMDLIAKRAPGLLGFHYAAQRKTLATVKRPIQAWYVTGTRGAYGTETVDNAAPSPNATTGDIMQLGGQAGGRAGSRLTAGLASKFYNVLIVVDAKKAAGYPIGAIADYVAVLALSQAQTLDGCSPLPSILDLMSEGCAAGAKPDGVTTADIAYLKGLYSSELEATINLERGDIAGRMMQDLKPRQ
jgi:hypothetical protein